MKVRGCHRDHGPPEIKVYGHVAVESGRMLYTENSEKHTEVLRVYSDSRGPWQLLSHAAIANAK